MSTDDNQSSGDQASTLNDIKKLLQELSDKTERQHTAVTSLSDKFVSFQEQCGGQLAALTASHSEIMTAHNAYTDRVDFLSAGVSRTAEFEHASIFKEALVQASKLRRRGQMSRLHHLSCLASLQWKLEPPRTKTRLF